VVGVYVVGGERLLQPHPSGQFAVAQAWLSYAGMTAPGRSSFRRRMTCGLLPSWRHHSRANRLRACRHSDLQRLVDAGRGDVPLKDLRAVMSKDSAVRPW
jgi:hypothetical protein